MLANLFAEASDVAKSFDVCKIMQNCSDLPKDASAQWYAGLLYAYQY